MNSGGQLVGATPDPYPNLKAAEDLIRPLIPGSLIPTTIEKVNDGFEMRDCRLRRMRDHYL